MIIVRMTMRIFALLILGLITTLTAAGCGSSSSPHSGSGSVFSAPISSELLGIAPGTTENLTANVIVDPGTPNERTVPLTVNSATDTVDGTVDGLTSGTHVFRIVFLVNGNEVASSTISANITPGQTTQIAFDPSSIQLTVPARLLFYTTVGNGSDGSGLFGVDTGNPTATPVQIEAASQKLIGIQFVLFGIWDAARQRVMGTHYRTVIYGKPDGHLYKVSALKADNPTPVQVSNEAGATTICNPVVAPDFTDNNNTVLVYTTSVDTNCSTTGDNVQKMVRLGMTATDSPITISSTLTPFSPLRDTTSGAITGWLATNGVSLLRCDPNLTCPSKLADYTSAPTRVDNDLFGLSGLMMVDIDDNLRVYNVAKGTLTNSIYAVMSPSTFDASYAYASDGKNLYFADFNGANIVISKLPISETGSASELFTVENGASFAELALTTNTVVFHTSNSGTETLRSVNKAGGTPTPLVSTTVSLNINSTAGSFVYYQTQLPLFGMIKEDGTGKTEIPNANFSGVVSSSMSLLNTGSKDLLLPSPGPLLRILWADGCANSSSCPNGTLKSIDATSAANPLTIGTIPSDIDSLLFVGRDNDSLGLGGGSTTTNIFYMNSIQANSLVRITNTNGASDYPVGCGTVLPFQGTPPSLWHAADFLVVFGIIFLLFLRKTLRKSGSAPRHA